MPISPIDYSGAASTVNPFGVAKDLAGLQAYADRRQATQQQQAAALAKKQKDEAFYQAAGDLDFNNQAELSEFSQANPQYLEQIQGMQQYQTQLKRSGATEASGSLYQLLEQGDIAGARTLLADPATQQAINSLGPGSFTAENALQMLNEDPDSLKDLSLSTYRFAGGDLSRIGIKDPAKVGKTAAVSDYEYYQELKKTDKEGAAQFGRKAGFISREGQELSGHMQKRLSTASDLAVESENNAGRFKTLADDFTKANVGGGLFSGKWGESIKDITGNQDAVTDLRKRYNAVRASLVVKNLPPGAASDTDIALALSGFPSDNATGEQISSFMRGMAKIEEETARFNNFKSEFISEHGAERTKDGQSMLSQWKKLRREEETAKKQAQIDKEAERLAAAETTAGGQPPAGTPPANPQFEGMDTNQIVNTLLQSLQQQPPAQPLSPQEQAYQSAYGRRGG